MDLDAEVIRNQKSRDSHDELKKRFDALEAEIRGSMARVESSVGGLAARVDPIAASHEETQRRGDDHRGVIEELGDDLRAFMKRAEPMLSEYEDDKARREGKRLSEAKATKSAEATNVEMPADS